MKAALGFCSGVQRTKVGNEVYITVRLPLNTLELAKDIFRGRRVLVTLAGTELDAESDGMKTGEYRNGLPVLSDVAVKGNAVV